MAKGFSLEDFQSLMREDEAFKNKVATASDIIDLDNGSMVIHRENLTRYLEQYCCKDESDLENTMWFSYGVYVKVI